MVELLSTSSNNKALIFTSVPMSCLTLMIFCLCFRGRQTASLLYELLESQRLLGIHISLGTGCPPEYFVMLLPCFRWNCGKIYLKILCCVPALTELALGLKSRLGRCCQANKRRNNAGGCYGLLLLYCPEV